MNNNQSPNFEGPGNRRSERPLLRLPVQVEGCDADGKVFKERTFTILINRNGARISLKHGVRPGDQVTITNLLMQQSSSFRVVECTDTYLGEDLEWGVECLETIEAFWGVIFPEKREDLPTANIIDALLECRECHIRELAKLLLDDYRELNNQGSLKRDCPKCGAEREWILGTVDVSLEDGDSRLPNPIATAPASERRNSKRYVVRLPLRTRNWDGREEVTRTETLSAMGMCFMSELGMKEGDVVFLTAGDVPENQKVEVSARIAWRRPVGGSKSLYGARFADPKLSPGGRAGG